ncbi:IS5 family transposase [Bradyrhizobium sp. CIR48]|nr:IS5 family transposase [Bradyrhizobium sp. CIR48]
MRTMILCCIGRDDAAEEAQDDGIERSVPGKAGPDNQHESRAGSARWQGQLGLDRRRDAPLYSENGRPGIETRFVIGLLLLKHIFGLSNEGVCERWVHDPYFQFFTGEEFFQHVFPHEHSDLSHWRKRLGDKLELLLAESLRVAHQAGALRGQDPQRVTVDTMVQPKAITFPTDAKLLHAAINGLNRLARRHGVRLRQSYSRVAKAAAMMAGPLRPCQTVQAASAAVAYLAQPAGPDHRRHPPQDRGPACTGGGVRPPAEPSHLDPLAAAAPARLEAVFLPCSGGRVHRQGQGQRTLRVGVKASIVTNNRRDPGGLFVLHARAMPDNPYDGHTLRDVLDRTETLTGCSIERAYLDKGYRGHDAQNPVASSSPARSAASSVSSSASCAAAPPSSPSSDT